jgi:hypothetical protein
MLECYRSAKTCDKRGGFMQLNTIAQRNFVDAKLKELDERASELLPDTEVEVVHKGEGVMRYVDHALVLTQEGLIYRGWGIKETKGLFGRTVTRPAREATRVNNPEQRERMLELFNLGPDNVDQALAELADPYQGSVQP